MNPKDFEWELTKEKLGLKSVPLPAHDLFAGAVEVMTHPEEHSKTSAQGIKHDSGKTDLSLIPLAAIESEARALMFGEKKYGRYNYTAGFESSRLVAAALRHIYSYNNGSTFDSESGLHHIGHARACLAMLLHCEELGTLTDNRYRR